MTSNSIVSLYTGFRPLSAENKRNIHFVDQRVLATQWYSAHRIYSDFAFTQKSHLLEFKLHSRPNVSILQSSVFIKSVFHLANLFA